MTIRAVIFDLDGTLLDTIGDLADTMNAALERMGHPPVEEEAYKRFVGDGVVNLVRRALPESARDEESIARGAALMREEYASRWDRRTRPYDGVPALLDGLAARGVSRAVLSNKPEHFTLLCVERLLGSWSFDLVRGARPGVPKKPDPGAALEMAAELGVNPGSILYLGDTNTDMRTAVAAGMVAVGALWGFRDEPELRETGARHLLSRPEDLLPFLDA